MYSYSGNYWPQFGHSLYYALSKPLFIFGMMMTVLPSCLGITHSFFNFLLTAKVFIFIARISFCTYLVHLMVMLKVIYDRTYDIYYEVFDVFSIYLGVLVISLFFGFILTMTAELPFANLLKMLMANMKQSSKKAVQSKSESLLTN